MGVLVSIMLAHAITEVRVDCVGGKESLHRVLGASLLAGFTCDPLRINCCRWAGLTCKVMFLICHCGGAASEIIATACVMICRVQTPSTWCCGSIYRD